MGVDFFETMVFYCFLPISEKKLITDLEKKIKKYMFLPTFANFNLIIYNLFQYRYSEWKHQHTVIKLRKSIEVF